MTKLSISCCAALFASQYVQPALAQNTSASAAVIAEGDIIVTAQKRGERLLDVPMAVTALRPEELLSQNLVSAKDYLAAVPGVQISTRQAGRTQINIRGISTGVGANPLVGIVIDDIPYGSSTVYGQGAAVIPDLDPFILGGIEILRGPQGTLYGASSMGGLLKLQTRSPSLTETSGAIQAGVSTVSKGGEGYFFRGAVNTPLSDKVAVSISGFYRQDGGYINDPGLGRKDKDGIRAYGGRIAFLAEPTDTLKVRLSAIYQDQHSDVSSQMDVDLAGNPIDGDLEHRRLIGTDGFDSSVQFYSLILDQEIGGATLTSLTSYSQAKLSNPTDLTLVDAGYATDATGIVDPGVFFDNRVRTRKLTQEFRISSPDDGPITYLAGLFFAREKSLFLQDEYASDKLTGALLSPSIYYTSIGSTYKEFAAFATLTWKIAPQFDIALGGRYSHNIFEFSGVDGDYTGPYPPYGGRSKENPFTFSVSPRYHLSKNVMAYARVASGFRAGGANAGAPAALFPTFDSDELINYEVGLKGQSDDGVVSGTVAAYYIDWKKIQVTQRDDIGNSYLLNAAAAQSKGIEAELSLKPLDGLSLSGSVTYNKAELAEDAPPGTFYGFKGDRLPYSARWTATASGEYRFPIGDGTSAFIGANLLYTGRRLSDFVNSATQTRFALPSYTTVDLRAGAEFDSWTLTAFVRNVGDKRGFVSERPLLSRSLPPIAVSVITPRTIGISLAKEF